PPLATRRGRDPLAFPGPAEDRDIRATGQIDANGVVLPGEQVVALERPPQASRLDPNDRVDSRVEVLAASEHAGGDRRLREVVGAAGQSFLDDEADEVARARGGVEVTARQNPVELFEDGLALRDVFVRPDSDLLHRRPLPERPRHEFVSEVVQNATKPGLASKELSCKHL